MATVGTDTFKISKSTMVTDRIQVPYTNTRGPIVTFHVNDAYVDLLTVPTSTCLASGDVTGAAPDASSPESESE